MRIFTIAVVLACGIGQVASAETPVSTDQAPKDQIQAGAEITRPIVQDMNSADIRRFNATVSSKHRYFIICRQSAVTGSLAKVTRVCQTREDWERGTREAQAEANDLLAGGRASAGCNPYCLEGQPMSAGTPQ